jgi:hypothetical protein
MQRTKPPFRADEVGSLLRPQRIKEARARLEKGEITPEELRKAEDMEIEKVAETMSGTVNSEIPLGQVPTSHHAGPAVSIRARCVSGDVLVERAAGALVR